MQSNRQSLGRNRHDRTADPSDDPAGRAPGRPHWAEEETQGPGQDDRGNSHCRRHRHRARCAGVVLCIPGGRLQGRGHDRLRHPGLHPVHGGGQRHHQSQGLRHRHARLGHHSGALRPGGRPGDRGPAALPYGRHHRTRRGDRGPEVGGQLQQGAPGCL